MPRTLHTYCFFICLLMAAYGVLPLPAAGAATPYSPHRDIVQGPVTGEVVDILDGDTINVRLHVWIGETIETHVRIDGIDAPEIKGKCQSERQRAQAARDEIIKLLAQSGTVSLSDIRLEKYAGRVLAKAKTAEGINIADHMISNGYARPYAGQKRAGWCGGEKLSSR